MPEPLLTISPLHCHYQFFLSDMADIIKTDVWEISRVHHDDWGNSAVTRIFDTFDIEFYKRIPHFDPLTICNQNLIMLSLKLHSIQSYVYKYFYTTVRLQPNSMTGREYSDDFPVEWSDSLAHFRLYCYPPSHAFTGKHLIFNISKRDQPAIHRGHDIILI